jgi:transcriptional regulator with XRE-family HTH domain
MPGVVDDALLAALAAEVKSRRLALQLTQQQLGERASMGALFVSRMENAHNQPSLTAFVRLAAGLEVSAAELLESVLARQRSASRSRHSR